MSGSINDIVAATDRLESPAEGSLLLGEGPLDTPPAAKNGRAGFPPIILLPLVST
jgi:hypothetical protein